MANTDGADGAEISNMQQNIPRLNGRTTDDSEAKDDEPTIQIDKKCLLLEDTTLEAAPAHLKKLLQAFDINKLNQAELLFLLVYLVAIESGFVAQNVYDSHADELYKTPPSIAFHSKNVLFLSSHIPEYKKDENKLHFVLSLYSNIDAFETKPNAFDSLLAAIVTGDFMIVTLTPDPSTKIEGSSICLSIARYVLGTPRAGKPPHHIFRKLDDLSLQLRSILFVPLRNRQLSLITWMVYPALNGLPEELYAEIFQYLNENQINIVANVNRKLNFVAKLAKERNKTNALNKR